MIRILYIEDDALLAKSMLRLFEVGFPAALITHADHYDAAITHLKAGHFDIVLSDFNLFPGSRNGGDVLRWIEQHKPELRSRFVFLSANERCADHGVPWLEKPCPWPALTKTISDVVGVDV